jgi:hypothetical protein
MPREIGKGTNRQEHQPDKKDRRESQYAVNHFALGNQMHEITRHERGFANGDKERDPDIDFAVPKRDVRRPNGNKCAEQKGVKDKEIAPDVVSNIVVRMSRCIHNRL